jgi:MFS family permease
MRKVGWRLIPLLVLSYFFAFVDKVNVGFAALTMNQDLHLSATAFGFGAGVFFIAYFIFEVPSNIILTRVGARRWIARIMVTFALASGAMAFVQGEKSFYAVRFLIGAAEAGFFPGIIFFMMGWFPAAYRARMMGYFIAAVPLSFVIGAPVSALFFHLDGALGMAGWKWLYIGEAVPALLLSGVVLKCLLDRPEDATWLTSDEKSWLRAELAAEQTSVSRGAHFGIRRALTDPRILGLSVIYAGAVTSTFGVAFFLPTIVKGFGLSLNDTTLVTTIPYVIGTIGMIWWGRRSDRLQERMFHAAAPLFLAALGLIGATLLPTLAWKVAAFSVGALGSFSLYPVFWTLPPRFLSGTAAAAGIAAINSLANLAGFAAPFAVGLIKDQTGSFVGGLWLMAAAATIGGLAVIALHRSGDWGTRPIPATVPAGSRD